MKQYLIGLDVGGTNIKMMICDDSYRPVGKRTIPTRGETGYEAISNRIITALEELFAQAGIREKRVPAVAMGLPGIVDNRAKLGVHLAYLGWNGFNPCEKIARHFGADSFLDNDASLNALGEYYFGVNQRYRDMVLLTLGTGVGCGIILGGRLFGGSQNLAGELGHLTVTPDEGAVCLCGKRGCLEAYCSGSAMKRRALELMERHPETLLHSLVEENGGVFDNSLVDTGTRGGDAVCVELYRQFNHYLAIGIASVMKLFNPERVLIGGGLSNAGALIFEPVNRDVKRYLLHERQYCPVEKAVLGPQAGMYGAVALAGIGAGLRPPACP